MGNLAIAQQVVTPLAYLLPQFSTGRISAFFNMLSARFTEALTLVVKTAPFGITAR
jgi:hypothetical protein